jgi:hypothetical protein
MPTGVYRGIPEIRWGATESRLSLLVRTGLPGSTLSSNRDAPRTGRVHASRAGRGWVMNGTSGTGKDQGLRVGWPRSIAERAVRLRNRT